MTTQVLAAALQPGMTVSITRPRSFNPVRATVLTVAASPYSSHTWVTFSYGQAGRFRRDFAAGRTVAVIDAQ